MQQSNQHIRQNRLANLLIEASPLAVVLTDSQGSISLINQTAASWFGYDESELVGKPVEAIVHGDADSADSSHAACLMSRWAPWPIAGRKKLLGWRKDGSRFPVRVDVRTFTDASEEMVLANIVNLNELDPQLREPVQGDRLTAVLEMASGLAHESNNALQKAQACLELLEMDLSENDDLLRLTDGIRHALTDIHQSYEAVKDYAAPIQLRKTPTNLADLCQSTFAELISTTVNQPATDGEPPDASQLVIVGQESCRRVSVDADAFKRVLARILKNAIDASPQNGKIRFSCTCFSLNGRHNVEISIQDHGIGLQPETARRMFEPFYTTKQRGSGLGLAICRRIVRAHHGAIGAQNHPDGGTVVRITIPRE